MSAEGRNEELFARARQVIPGGVDSPVRAFRSVGGIPYFVARAEGPHVWDEEGRRYVDWVQSYGATILGLHHLSQYAVIESWSGYFHATNPDGTESLDLGSPGANVATRGRL